MRKYLDLQISMVYGAHMLNPQQVATNHVDTVEQHYQTKIIL